MRQMEEALTTVKIGDDVVICHKRSAFNAGGLFRGRLVGRTKTRGDLTVDSQGSTTKYGRDGSQKNGNYGTVIRPATGEKLAALEKQEAERAKAAALLAEGVARQDAVKIRGSKVATFVAEFEMNKESARVRVIDDCEILIRELRHTIDSLTPGRRGHLHGHLSMPQMLSTIAEGIGNFNALENLRYHMLDALEAEKLK